MRKFTLPLKKFLFISLGLILLGFTLKNELSDDMEYIQQVLNEHYDLSQEQKLVKKYEFQVTSTGFCRYRKYFNTGKVEYFSFNLKRFKDLDYIGDDKEGKLVLNTLADDVIVQTYKDRKHGDIDSMAAFVVVPVKAFEPEGLNALSDRIKKVNAGLSALK